MDLRSDYSPKEWDALLATMGGHPLQSALWGDAKHEIYGVTDQRLALYDQDKLAALVRVENKGLKSFLKLAWIPQGPTLAFGVEWKNIQNDFLKHLKQMGNSLCVASPWQPQLTTETQKKLRQTVWIDLRLGKEKLWSGLDKKWRYGVRSAQRLEIQISFASTHKEVFDFYQLCITVSQEKTFRFQHTQAFLQYLLDHSDKEGAEAKLFLVKLDNEIAAGAFILRIGRNCHYMWGAMDRKYSKLRVGEFVQWSVIEWACEKNCALYDLEGIDEIKNPGVATFKKKMGGEVTSIPNLQIHNFNLLGKFLSPFIRKKLQ